MLISDRIYLKRVGGLVCWRVLRIGGSFYYSTKHPQVASFERAMAAQKRATARRELYSLRRMLPLFYNRYPALEQ